MHYLKTDMHRFLIYKPTCISSIFTSTLILTYTYNAYRPASFVQQAARSGHFPSSNTARTVVKPDPGKHPTKKY